MPKRLLIIGGGGFVGSWWARAASQSFAVWCASRTPRSSRHWLTLDITDQTSVASVLAEIRPDIVTHLAALSDIDRCEREPELAELINHAGTRNVATACTDAGARLIYTSSDAVFDGTKSFYREDDPPTPANGYGDTKARAEAVVTELVPNSAIVRMSLVLGRSRAAGSNSYLEKVSGNLRAGNQIISPTYEYRNPIDVVTLCRILSCLADEPQARGIFHVGASDKISRFDLTRQLARELGGDESLVVPETAPVAGRAPRGRDDFLASERLVQWWPEPLPSCQQVIQRALVAEPPSD